MYGNNFPVPISSLFFWDQTHMLEVPLIGWLFLHINTLWTKLIISPPPLHPTSTPTTTLLQPCLEEWDLCSVTQAKCLRNVPVFFLPLSIHNPSTAMSYSFYSLKAVLYLIVIVSVHTLAIFYLFLELLHWLWTFFSLASVIFFFLPPLRKCIQSLEIRSKQCSMSFQHDGEMLFNRSAQ